MKNELSIRKFFKKIKLLKDDNTVRKSDLSKEIKEIESKASSAKALGQTILVDKLNGLLSDLKREQGILEDIDTDELKFIYLEQLKKYIKSVENKVTKIVNLEDYERIIPESNAKEILKYKDANIFDKYIVVFNDTTSLMESSKVKEDVERVRKEAKDPIVFGCFYNEVTVNGNKMKQPGDKLYFITEWEDEDCNISLSEIIEKSIEYKGEFEDIEIESIDDLIEKEDE